jgi:L-ascorbate metabolism protein UlaG (beta-lactamase superfamily)
MKVVYIHHSGFYVELERVQMVFDYVGGPLPEIKRDKELLIFASHRHGDHFDPMIFELASRHPRARYFLAYDIRAKKIPTELADKVTSVRSHAVIEYKTKDISADADDLSKRAEETAETVTIRSYKSTDEGVAFMVQAEGYTIYHAGDLNDWHWEGETSMYNNNMKANYLRELKRMHTDGLHPDIAMVPVDGRLEDSFYIGLKEYMDEVGAAHIFPMHFWKDYTTIDRIRSHESAAEYKDKIAQIEREGQEFQI